MSVYKEMGSAIRALQNRIIPLMTSDSGGVHGIPIKDKNDPSIIEVKGIMGMYGIEPVTTGKPGKRVQTFEFDGEYPAVVEAGFEKAIVKYYETPKHPSRIGYITVETLTSKEAERKANEYRYSC